MEEYIVSARKYRPTTFDSVVGQLALTTTLKNAVRSGKLAHAYLFCGPRGVGKTTCARIFAKAINCMTPTADGEACGQCESCEAFNEQRSFNIFELDAASNNSVEHIKTLMEQTRIPPQVGKYKVFIIDEVHMLSTQAFNAFLKTLEEPPAHVIFILATTEKHKILPTILSRCQIYDFERMTVQGTIDHLKYVAQKEGIQYEDEALAVIAEKADGGMRDALSIFDQAASFCQGNITYQKVIEDLNVLDADNYFRIIDLSVENKVSDVMVLLNSVINSGFDTGQLIQGLARHVRNVLMAKDEVTLPLLEVSRQQAERYKEQAKKCDTRFLYEALRLMNQCDINYRQSANKRLLVELTLIEIAQITQPDDMPAAGRRPKRLKNLFKQMILQLRQQKPAPQVAAAKVAETIPSSVSQQEGNPVGSSETPSISSSLLTPRSSVTGKSGGASPIARKRPQLKERIGVSFGNILQKEMPKIQQEVVEEPKQEENTRFTDEDLQFQWLSMCNRMPEQYIGMANRMKSMMPVITEFPAVEVVVDNELAAEELKKISRRVVATLQKNLHNTTLTLNIRIAEPKERSKVLSRREQYEELEKKNPSVAKLREIFELELA